MIDLSIMESFKDDLNWEYKAKKSFRIIIVGAGIAGLAAGIGMLTFRSPFCLFLIES